MVEFSIIASSPFMLLGGLIDFSYAFYQWNSATKALQRGTARGSLRPSPDSSQELARDGRRCRTAIRSSRTHVQRRLRQAAVAAPTQLDGMNTIVYGRGQTSCGAVGADQTPGMCDVFSRVQPHERHRHPSRLASGLQDGLAGRCRQSPSSSPGSPLITSFLVGCSAPSRCPDEDHGNRRACAPRP